MSELISGTNGATGAAAAAAPIPAPAATVPPVVIQITPDRRLSTASVELEVGRSYNLDITRVPSTPPEPDLDVQFRSPDFFNACFILQAKVAGLEVKTRHIDYLEFDAPGTIRVSLIPSKAGTFSFWVPEKKGGQIDTAGEAKGTFTVRRS